MASKKQRNHYDLKQIENCCRTKTFPRDWLGKRKKQILDEPKSDFPVNKDNYITESRLFIADKDLRYQSLESNFSYIGRTPTYEKLAASFFLYRISNDVRDCIQKCDRCQKQHSLSPNVKNEIHNVPFSLQVMKQVDLDLCFLPEVDGYRHLFAWIHYFTKWSEAKPIRDKTTLTVATFFMSLSVVMVASKSK